MPSFALDAETIIKYGARILIIFMVLPIHEAAHAWMAYKCGDRTALYKGRLTLNPVAHIDPLGAILLMFTGFGWAKPVPVNPLSFKKYRRDYALTALAGPLSNLIVAFIAMIGLRVVLGMNSGIWMDGSTFHYINGLDSTGVFYAILFLNFIITINIGLALFNLIPVPPLDGSKIISYFTSAKYEMFLAQNQMMISIIFMAVIFSGILSIPLGIVNGWIYDLFALSTNWVESLVA